MVQSVKDSADQPVADDDATIVVGEQRTMPDVSGYQITKHIGVGGMADVWLGVDDNLKRQAAVKTMSAALITDPEFIQRFAEEAQTVAGFRHDNIVTVFSSGSNEQHHWIAMEYISGGTLSDRLKQGPLPLDEALPIAQAMAKALAYSHEHRIIHRDFKPGNILFTGDGTPVLSDFGIAKSTETEEGEGLTVPGLVIGSPRYMAPEQMLGKHVTSKVDVYALGLVLVEMLVGDVPSPDISMITKSNNINGLTNFLPGQSTTLIRLIGDCLRAEPEQRPDGGEVAARLAELIEPRRGISKRARLLTATGFAVLIVALIASQFRQTEFPLDVSFEPVAASLYVDGQLMAPGEVNVGAGRHELVLVDPQYYGQVVVIEDTTPVDIALEKLRLPSFEEFSDFNRLEDAPLAELVDQQLSYAPFQSLIQLRTYGITGQTTELTQMVDELNTLAAVGDPAAQAILFVANIDQVIEGDRFSGLIQQASNSGYGLATFFQALHYRWANTGETGMDRSSLPVYRSLMALAEEQGLAFANTYVQEADNLLKGA